MRRDYKDYRPGPRGRAREPVKRRRQGVPGWAWGILGLTAGLGVAAWVYLGGYRAPGAPAAVAPPVSAPPLAEAPKKAPEPPAAAAKPPAPPPAPKPRFEFYTMLPEMEVPAHEPGTGKVEAPAAKPGETYTLQVASFRSYEEADRLKASLSLLGMEASIQSVTAEGKPPIHRVRVGPYTDMAKVNEARRRLKEHALDPILVKGRT
ncbi:MAG: SPOR domain-containing protein [Gammaproteobacteria bacterium]|jgi:cell division protein FtsN|nr:SPOR domain-containing protein [Gammaproteobacteria bacterium]